PVFQGGFFRTARLDALTTRVRDAARRLVQQKGLVEIRAIDERREGLPEGFDCGWIRIRFGEVQPGTGGYAVRFVACATPGFLKHRIDGLGKVSGVGNCAETSYGENEPASNNHGGF